MNGGFLMNIAIITGASSGLGFEYIKLLDKKGYDELWLIARREQKLSLIASQCETNCRIIPMDMTLDNSHHHFSKLLNELKPNIKLMINNAGFGKLGYFEDIDAESTSGMIRLNCEALTLFTHSAIPFMKKGSEIINISSIASFVPNARMAVYSSTKAYVTSFSRALRYELKRKKIKVLAVCPGPMDTEFLPVANIEKGTSLTFDTLPRVSPATIAKKSLIASKKGKAIYTGRLFYKFYRFLSRIIPYKILMKLAAT